MEHIQGGSQTNKVVRLSLITIVLTLAIAGCSTTPQYQYNQTERYNYEGASVDNDAIAYYNRGVDKQNLGDYEGAIADYNRALEIDPDHDDASDNRERLLKKL